MLRIANAGGYWGDDPYALRRQLSGSLALDFIVIDYLAELTMSILQKQKVRDPSLGYATDFITQAAPLLGAMHRAGVRLVTNAGGVNPRAAAAALAAAVDCPGLRIAVVEGDDLLDRLGALAAQGQGLANMETGEPFAPIAPRTVAANAYFGAQGIKEALLLGAHVVICGRVTDTAITLGPLLAEFGW